MGFVLWGCHLLAFPFLDTGRGLTAASYLLSATLALFIINGIVIEQESTAAEKTYRDTELAYLNLIGSYLTAAAQMDQAVGREVL